jgi:hypothetical protein
MRTSTQQTIGFNVAKQSTSGHYLKNASVISTNEDQGTYVCKNTEDVSVLETSNHGTVQVSSPTGFAVFTQVEFNNLSQVFEKARD